MKRWNIGTKTKDNIGAEDVWTVPYPQNLSVFMNYSDLNELGDIAD